MTKAINKRNFLISKGDLSSTYIDYQIDERGLENILILGEMKARVYIVVNDGEIESLEYGNKYIKKNTLDEREIEDLEKAKEIYEEVKFFLNVDEELEKYNFKPRESNLFEFLGISSASQIKTYFLNEI